RSGKLHARLEADRWPGQCAAKQMAADANYLLSPSGGRDGFMTTALRVTQAYKRFGTTQALDGAEITLKRGQLLLLLGPNGAGKTTLIRAVAGRVRLDQGQIELLGKSLNGSNGDARRSLGIVPQEIALYPMLTARENLEVFGA